MFLPYLLISYTTPLISPKFLEEKESMQMTDDVSQPHSLTGISNGCSNSGFKKSGESLSTLRLTV